MLRDHALTMPIYIGEISDRIIAIKYYNTNSNITGLQNDYTIISKEYRKPTGQQDDITIKWKDYRNFSNKVEQIVKQIPTRMQGHNLKQCPMAKDSISTNQSGPFSGPVANSSLDSQIKNKRVLRNSVKIALFFIAKLLLTKSAKNNYSLYTKIQGAADRSVYQRMRTIEKEMKKSIKIKQDIEFIRSCITYNLKPKFTQFKVTSQALRNSASYNTCQQRLLKTELRDKQRINTKLSKSNNKEIAQIRSIFDGLKQQSLFINWHDKLQNVLKYQMKQITNKQTTKLVRLGMPIGTYNPAKRVYNFSSKPLNPEQLKLLDKGCDFIINNKKINRSACMIETEKLFNEIKYHQRLTGFEGENNSELKQQLRKTTLNYIYRKEFNLNNISTDEERALDQLLNDESIIIVKSDKVNTFVILDKKLYIEKRKRISERSSIYKINS